MILYSILCQNEGWIITDYYQCRSSKGRTERVRYIESCNLLCESNDFLAERKRFFKLNSNYNDIKRVYSIWVCMNMPENSLEHIHLVKDSIVNSHAWKGKMDLVNIVMIGLSEELPKHEEKYELHRLLGALLSQDLTVNEKLDIIGNEYAIPMEKDFREDVSIMCNLSQKIKETGIEMGKREMIMKMYNKGYTAAQIADVAEMDEKKIKDIIKNAELLTV